MRTFITLILVVISFVSFSQDTIQKKDTLIKQVVISPKVVTINPLPLEIFNVLKTDGDVIEVTMYTSSKTFTLPKNKGMNYFLSFLIGKSPAKLNPKNIAYAMFMVKEDFYLDAEISISDEISYVVFKKEGKKYYNLLNQKGIDFLKKMM